MMLGFSAKMLGTIAKQNQPCRTCIRSIAEEGCHKSNILSGMSLNLKSKRRMHKLYERHVRQPVWPTTYIRHFSIKINIRMHMMWTLNTKYLNMTSVATPGISSASCRRGQTRPSWQSCSRNSGLTNAMLALTQYLRKALDLFQKEKLETPSLLDPTSCIQRHLVFQI